MYNNHLKHLVVNHNELVSSAVWKSVGIYGGTLCVIDDNDRFVGVVGGADYPQYHESIEKLKVADICNRRCKYIIDNEYSYYHGKHIFETCPQISMLPMLNDDKKISDVLFRFQAFYEDYFNHRLFPNKFDGTTIFSGNYMYYAYCLWLAAQQAKNNGYKKISVIEFGVFTGKGLRALEWHSHAMERIFGLTIEVYGFDSGEGLPHVDDWRNGNYHFPGGIFKMGNPQLLGSRLFKAKLILGDINETLKSFINEYNPAPIAVMLVDVDLYTSTVPILELLESADDYFLPRVFMYFDDIRWNTSLISGESLAIKEFNTKHNTMKISPESGYDSYYCAPIDFANGGRKFHGIKTCHRFLHKNYNNPSSS